MMARSDYAWWKPAARCLIAGLPADATIVVLTNDIGRHLKRGIAEMRGKAFARGCRTVAVNRHCDLPKLMGLRPPLLIDPSIGLFAEATVFASVLREVVAAGAARSSTGVQYAPEQAEGTSAVANGASK